MDTFARAYWRSLGLPIYSAIISAISEGKCDELREDTRELGQYISIKLNIISQIILRINEGVSKLKEEIQQHDETHVFTKDTNAYAFPIDNVLKYRLMADIESFLFQLNATWELIRKFISEIYTHAGYLTNKKNVINIIEAAHEKNNQNTNWFPLLDSLRNFITHDGAIYLAVDISDANGWDLLAMKKMTTDFDSPKTFFKHSDLVRVYEGFSIAKHLIQSDLIGLFAKTD